VETKVPRCILVSFSLVTEFWVCYILALSFGLVCVFCIVTLAVLAL